MKSDDNGSKQDIIIAEIFEDQLDDSEEEKNNVPDSGGGAPNDGNDSGDKMTADTEISTSESDLDESENKKKKKKKSGRALKIVFVIVLVLVVGLGAVIGTGLTVVNKKMDRITKVQVDREALGIDPRVAKELKNYRNIALLGIDSRDVNDDSNSRSDAMIIASINKTTGEVRLISIYRDTYLSLGDDFGMDKLTHAYFYGGPTQTLQSINRNLDLNCEETIVVNWKSVADAVDALGGLDITIKESEISEMNKYIKDTQKNIGGSKKKIKKAGKQVLNGNQAVTYARIRKDSVRGDYRRNERMEAVVQAAFAKAKTKSLSELDSISDQILPQVKTNMTNTQLMDMLLTLNSYKMGKSESWPYKTESMKINGIYYGPPITLKSNVIELHEKQFGQKDYQPTDTVLDISDQISSLTNRW